jgi:DNA-binding transcriptional ArsR family regulator
MIGRSTQKMGDSTQLLGIITQTLSDTSMAKLEVSERPLTGIFGSQSACQVLLYLENYEKGYASEIARTFGISLNQAQNQLKKFEEAGLLVSRDEGNTRMYYIKRSPVTDALRRFLREMLDMLPSQTTEKYFRQRRRPRRFGKR